jgi:hypothetical protein
MEHAQQHEKGSEQQEAGRERRHRELPATRLRPVDGDELATRASACRSARAAALPGGRASARCSATSASRAASPLGVGAREARRLEARATARTLAASVEAPANSAALSSAACSERMCEVALSDALAVVCCAQIEMAVTPASNAAIATTTLRSASRSRPPPVNPQSRATSESSARTGRICRGFASLERGNAGSRHGDARRRTGVREPLRNRAPPGLR